MLNPSSQILDLLTPEASATPLPHSSDAADQTEAPAFGVVLADTIEEAHPPNEQSPAHSFDDSPAEGSCDKELSQGGMTKTTPAPLLEALISGKQTGDILSGQQLDAEPGMYEIQDWSLSDNVLLATVANKNDKSHTFTLSIPAEHLKAGVDPNLLPVVETNLTEQNALAYEEASLEQYLSKLNLKEIEIIQPTNLTEAESTAKPSTLSIIGNGIGQTMVIQAQVGKGNLQTAREKLSGSSKPGKGDGGVVKYATANKNVSTNMQTDPIGDPWQALSKPAVPGRNGHVSEDDLTFMSSEKMETFTIFEELPVDTRIDHRQLNVRQVRFTLPDNVKSILRPNGYAITLRIEPEHLGPAKLSLTMINDKLQARVIVNDPMAKAAVEASLYRLVDQLSKANIEVDHVEVTISGESTRDGFFERRPRWHRYSGRAGRLSPADALSPGQQVAALGSVPGPALYVGADGVNLLA